MLSNRAGSSAKLTSTGRTGSRGAVAQAVTTKAAKTKLATRRMDSLSDEAVPSDEARRQEPVWGQDFLLPR